jgi:hypothetical protein
VNEPHKWLLETVMNKKFEMLAVVKVLKLKQMIRMVNGVRLVKMNISVVSNTVNLWWCYLASIHYYSTVNDHHVIATTVTHATIEMLLEAMFSVRYAPRLYEVCPKSI